ncbi:major facilitator superfamily domain-containing protein [Xylariales sp. PMI_506]|nr:major facilitator superfamily domain-containing protein [Xylariales sp. PMI_506]
MVENPTIQVNCMGSDSEVSLDVHEPVNFSARKKFIVVLVGIVAGINANLGSSLPSGATDAISGHFSISNPVQLALLNSIYLLGYAFGPLLFGPLSEHAGRRPVLVGTFIGYLVFTTCCAVSPSYSVLIFFRFLCGIAAAAPVAVVSPLYADIYNDPGTRGRVIAYFMCTSVVAPELGPIVSGYASQVSWNLPFWIGAAIAAASLPLVLVLPETYAPVLRRKAIRKSDGIVLDIDRSFLEEMRIVLSRPFIMISQEPVVLFTSIYCALVYAILYLLFQAYPIIFKGLYGFSPGQSGLAFLPVIAGCIIAIPIFLWYSSYHEQAFSAGATWAVRQEYRRLPLACFGGPAVVVALLWLGWTSSLSIHPVVPAMSGLLFGTGYLLIFISMVNYLSDAYRQYAASAQAAASTTRSLVAVCLPLAASPMYDALGVHWACSLLAFATLIVALIPFAFIKYGETLRRRSPFCQKLMEDDVAILGRTFMRSTYLVYDIDNLELGLTQATLNATTSNIIGIDTTTTINGATSSGCNSLTSAAEMTAYPLSSSWFAIGLFILTGHL